MQATFVFDDKTSVSYTSVSTRPATDEQVLFEFLDILTNDLGYTREEVTNIVNSILNAGLTLQWTNWRKEEYPNGKL